MTSVLVTGGTGSFGAAFARTLLSGTTARRIVVFSRDEVKQAAMREALASEYGADEIEARVRFMLGDVRDVDRLALAMQGVTTVVHAAALKRVDALEYDPEEAVKTNVLGAMNVAAAARRAGVHRVLGLSTDKAAQPVNLYGATKLTMEKLFIAENAVSGAAGPRFACTRYGNVAGSRGSVIPLWRRLAREGKPLPVTDARCSRFWMTLDEAVSFVLRALDRMQGAEVFVPKLPSFRVLDLAEAVWRAERGEPPTDRDLVYVGMRPGEKLHESLIGTDEARDAWDLGDCYILSRTGPTVLSREAVRTPGGRYEAADVRVPDPAARRVPDGFRYTSDTNGRWLDVPALRAAVEGVGGAYATKEAA